MHLNLEKVDLKYPRSPDLVRPAKKKPTFSFFDIRALHESPPSNGQECKRSSEKRERLLWLSVHVGNQIAQSKSISFSHCYAGFTLNECAAWKMDRQSASHTRIMFARVSGNPESAAAGPYVGSRRDGHSKAVRSFAYKTRSLGD